MSAVFLTTMGNLYAGSGINVNAVTVGEDGWIYLAGIDFSASLSPSYKHSLTVLAYKDGQLAWKQDFHDRAYGTFEALTFRNGAVYAAGAISTEFNVTDLTATDGSTVAAPVKKAIDPSLKALYDSKNPWIFHDPTYPIYVKLNGETGQVELAKVLPSPNVQGDDRLRSISVDSQGNVYVGGGGWNPGPNPKDSFNNADFYWFIRKFSTTGIQQWEQSAEAVSLDPFNNKLYLTRYQDQMVQLDTATGNDDKVFSSGLTYQANQVSHWVRGWTYDAAGNLYVLAGRQFWDSKISDFSDQHGILVKIDTASGNVVWTTPFGISADSCLPNSITFTPDGNLLVAGHVVGTLEGKVGFGGTDGFLMEFNPSTGSIVSTEVIGTKSYESISQVKYQTVLDKLTGEVIDYNMIIGGSFGVNRYSLEGRDEKDIYLITDKGFQLIGNALENYIQGGSGNDSIFGGVGNDELVGGLGRDALDGGDGYDIASYKFSNSSVAVDLKKGSANGAGIGTDTLKNIEEVIAGLGNDTLIASNFGSQLVGGEGDDTLTGGTGGDVLIGGAGNDTYVVNSTTDIITEASGEGTDTVRSSVTFSLANLANVENLTNTGNSAWSGTGNNLENVITGGAGSDTLTGGAGSDTLVGGAGNDTYVVDSITDIIREVIGGGTDTVRSSVAFSLANHVYVENLTYTGSAVWSGTGNSSANVITGSSGADTLDGGSGGVSRDTLIGGAGNDTYVVDSTTDTITELANGGTDTIQSSVTFSLAGIANVENLSYSGSTAWSATGNALNNTITAGVGSDTLTGGAGIDTLIGGAGNDTYVVDSTTDTITEASAEGTDTVRSSVTFSLATLANVENLTYTGSSAWSGTGNSLANVIMGSSGADTLDGGTGIDILTGGAGNDTYIVDSTTDTISEVAGGGTDIIQSSVTFTLAALANVENLTLTGTSNINATGNAAANILIGNSANNTLDGGTGNDTLSGGAGNDTLSGGSGKDTLTGGEGNDTFIFNTAPGSSNLDTLSDFKSGIDVVQLSKAIFTAFGSTGTLSANAFWSAAGATSGQDATDRIIYNTSTGALYYDADGLGGNAAVQIAIVGTSLHPTMGYTDFAVIA